jgi:hypothetical protein
MLVNIPLVLQARVSPVVLSKQYPGFTKLDWPVTVAVKVLQLRLEILTVAPTAGTGFGTLKQTTIVVS